MLILFTKQRVMRDMIEWARGKLVIVLRCHPSLVQAKWSLDPMGKTVVPEFSVAPKVLEGIPKDMLQDLFKTISFEMRNELNIRLKDLTLYRIPRDKEGHVIWDG